MCIGFIKVATSPNEKYKLIILNNRDEDLDRPTAPIHWHDGILSGVDEKDVARGTWLGMEASGKIGMLLSITQPIDSKHSNAPSRGGIVNEYLKSDSTTKFFESLKAKAEAYNGFQFVGIEKNCQGLFEVRSLTNQLVNEIEITKWNDKYHVYSNSPPHIPFKKADLGLRLFSESLENSDNMEIEEVFERLFEIATCRTHCFPDEQIRVQTGFPGEVYKPLTSIFVRFPETRRYGTRSHTLILVDRNDQVTVLERRMEAAKTVEESTWHDKKISFKL
uniref:Transport and Golgi organization protein 2 homolog n=1 Tax=Caenorhabditis tropicalis TaxID=1561998 RepID=A0A1I7T694_9PELO